MRENQVGWGDGRGHSGGVTIMVTGVVKQTTVWRQIFKEHNFCGFRGLPANRKNYAPPNNAHFSKTRTLLQLQLVGDQSMVLYRFK